MKGGSVPTLPGLIGQTKGDLPARSLGGLVISTTKSGLAKGTVKKGCVETERDICGPSKTKTAKEHYGSIQYPGMVGKPAGKKF